MQERDPPYSCNRKTRARREWYKLSGYTKRSMVDLNAGLSLQGDHRAGDAGFVVRWRGNRVWRTPNWVRDTQRKIGCARDARYGTAPGDSATGDIVGGQRFAPGRATTPSSGRAPPGRKTPMPCVGSRSLERLESRALVRRQPHAFACVTFCLTHPRSAASPTSAPNLRRDRDDRRPNEDSCMMLLVQDHPHRALFHLR